MYSSSCFRSINMISSFTNCINTGSGTFHAPCILQQVPMAKIFCQIDKTVQRRTANYKKNIWKYDDFQQSLASKFSEEKYKCKAEELREEAKQIFFCKNNDQISKLELVDAISKLGISSYFEEEIREVLNPISFPEKIMSGSHREDLYSISMWYRLLRQHGYAPSQDIFLEFMDKDGKLFLSSQDSNVKGLLELFQASNLHSEEENILKDAKLFSSKYLKKVITAYPDDHELAKQILNTLSLPLHWKVNWFNISKYIYELETENKTNFAALVDLAKLNFNMVQDSHQEDLKELSRWWLNLGITAKLSFSRDRLVESFRCAVGIASEPEYGSLRKWLGKIINLILVIDDVYDIYGSLEELVCFSNAVQRWKPEEIEELPECMKICFWALYNTTEEIAVEIQKEKGLNNSVLPYLQKAWGDFCNSLLLEAKWYNKLYFPSVKEYLDNGWTSSSGPLLAIHTILGISNQTTKDISEILQENRDLIYCTSLIIRLWNDQGTSAAELERGDAPSSILCYMREANVSEEEAREYVGNIIMETWERINGNSSGKLLQEPVKMHIINIARAAHFIYQNGDGFGEQEMETREQCFLV